MAEARRSMGTKKVDLPAIRGNKGSIENRESRNENRAALATSNLCRQSSSSRLPRARTTGGVGVGGRPSSTERGIQTRKRSSSSNQQNALSNAFRTPQGTSRGWTPTGNRSVGSGQKQLLNSLQNPMALRYSLAGNPGANMQSGLGRSSAIGAKKMNNKDIQRQTERELVDFCQAQGYDRAQYLNAEGSGKTFPLNSTEFKMIFVFLVRHLDHSLPDLSSKFAEEIPKILKAIAYPAHVSKQTFQTLGTTHSWPGVLAILHYLLQRAKLCLIIEDKFDEVVFPNKDENGFEESSTESEQKIRFDYFVDSYNAFQHNGEQDYSEYLKNMEKRFLSREGVDPRGVRKQKDELRQIKEQLAEERSAFIRVQDEIGQLTKEYEAKQNDLLTFKNYVGDLEKRQDLRMKEIEALKQATDFKREKESSIKENISELRNTCRTVKNIDPDNIFPQNEYAIEILEKQVNDSNDVIKSSDKSIWQGEMELSTIVNNISDICRKFNGKLIEIGLYPDSKKSVDDVDTQNTFKLDTQKSLNQVKDFLKTVEKNLQMKEKIVQEDYIKTEKELHLTCKEVETKKTSLEQTRAETEKRSSKKDLMQTKNNAEATAFNEQLSTLKSSLHAEKSKERKPLNQMGIELERLAEVEKELLKRRNQRREEGHTLMTEAPKVLLKKRQEKVEYLEGKIEEYKKQVKEKIVQTEDENVEITSYVESLPKRVNEKKKK